MKIKSILLGGLAVMVGLVMGGRPLRAQAGKTATQLLPTAPKGIAVNSYFTTGNIAGNAATLGDTSFGAGKAVILTSANNQVGAIWTTDAAKMNLNEDQTASMWMYFGDNRGTVGGDGMAFVMQNDPAGANAIAKKGDGTPSTGQTLGVWGTDARTDTAKPIDTDAMAKLAIQNSWAVEFDTQANKNASLDNTKSALTTLKAGNVSVFDQGISGPHIASNFPGKGSSYQSNLGATETTTSGWFPNYVTTTSNYTYATLIHKNMLREGNTTKSFSFLDNGNWRHVTMRWNSSTDEMTYTYDDEEPQAGDENPETGHPTYTSGPIKIDPQKDLGVGSDGLVRWGFTSSTGTRTEPNMVVFDQVPGLVNGKAAATLTDASQSDKVIDQDTDTVNDGDRMSLNFNLKYTSGRESWKDIVAKLNLPTNIRFKNAKIKYANGDTDTISDLKTDDPTGQSLSKSLENLNTKKDGDTAPNASADITLNGVASSGDADQTTVKGTSSSFEGSNAMMNASVSGFIVKKATGAMTMALTGDHISADGLQGSQSLTAAKDVTITGQIKYLIGKATNNNITLHPQMNGINLPTTTLNNDDPAGQFSYTIPASSLISGLADGNQLEMYATDNNGVNSGNDVKYTITLKEGSLDLIVNPKATFNVDHPQNLTGSAVSYPADSSWNVQVSDTLGTGDKWTLTATADPIISRLRGTLDGDLVYAGANGEQSLTQGSAVIDTHTTDSDNDQVNVTGGWNSKNGVLLKANAGAIQGSYMSTVHWSLNNTPATN